MPLHVVLHEPEIPQNTGNIARTCAAVGAVLHLIRPLGFETSSRYLKRAGLDYWNLVTVEYYDGLGDFFARNDGSNLFYLSTKAGKPFHTIEYLPESYLVFGKETAGLPEELLSANPDRCARIPMRPGARSLNLSNAVAIVVYEALRQLDFPGLQLKGSL
ncbi:MAG TPA: tRNA (cytidine(34)-2'-O)-methyltransferase [Spirochaetia bacterium]|nr:tRNA (cytidine(34)-2'-O)-methyltransferase [Spirochaetia bacterium]